MKMFTKFLETEQLFPVGVKQNATARKRSKAETPHCNPASLRELLIKTHTLPVSPKHRMLPTGQRDAEVCVSALLRCVAPVSISL